MFRQIFLEKWMPALITASIGGLLVAVLVPNIQSHYAEEAILKNRQIEVWESIGMNFTDFISSNFQLVTVTKNIRKFRQSGEEIPELLMSRKESYLQLRDLSASKLNRDLILAPFYFGSEVEELVIKYRRWIKHHRVATIDTMPARYEFEKWRDDFMKIIRDNMSAL